MNKGKDGKHGFTLIELLVGIMILAILAFIAYLIYIGVLARVRNGARAADAQALMNSLNNYYSSYGNYPNSSNWTKLEDNPASNPVYQALQPYFAQMPKDPSYGKKNSAGKDLSYQYKSTTNGQGFKIHIERENNSPLELSYGNGASLVFESGGGGGAICDLSSSDHAPLGEWGVIYPGPIPYLTSIPFINISNACMGQTLTCFAFSCPGYTPTCAPGARVEMQTVTAVIPSNNDNNNKTTCYFNAPGLSQQEWAGIEIRVGSSTKTF